MRNVGMMLTCMIFNDSWSVRTTVGFIAAVLAVRVSVTPPLLVNTLSWAALHLTGRTLGRRRWVTATTSRRLIWLVLQGAENRCVRQKKEINCASSEKLQFRIMAYLMNKQMLLVTVKIMWQPLYLLFTHYTQQHLPFLKPFSGSEPLI